MKPALQKQEQDTTMGKDWKEELERLGYDNTTDLIYGSPELLRSIEKSIEEARDPNTKWLTFEEVFGDWLWV